MTGVATVTIQLINENDNSPVFPYDEYVFDIAEEQAPGVLETSAPSPGISMIQVYVIIVLYVWILYIADLNRTGVFNPV